MTSAIFKQWLHKSFVPQVTSFLKEKVLPIKALLLIDNAPSHPNEAELTTENGQISAMFMPPNVTPLIHPMDQNAIKITKLHYRNSLLASIAATKSDLLESLKKIYLKTAINLLDAAWFRVGEVTLTKCWNSILNFAVKNDDPEDNVPLAIEFTLPAIHEWNEDIEEGNADDDHQQEDESDDDNVSEQLEKIKPTEAVEIFDKALIWAGHEDIDQNDMSMINEVTNIITLKMV
ncbi:jerky protein homolog-like [Anastrepha obliqua]|uniref:jerky protein homolog-like n=1 Tax=Anastrepha obliqua TaxID=95512 RepID=UPI0024099945|nr:jerky protein homolog-like [Anastrepha obliqua]